MDANKEMLSFQFGAVNIIIPNACPCCRGVFMSGRNTSMYFWSCWDYFSGLCVGHMNQMGQKCWGQVKIRWASFQNPFLQRCWDNFLRSIRGLNGWNNNSGLIFCCCFPPCHGYFPRRHFTFCVECFTNDTILPNNSSVSSFGIIFMALEDLQWSILGTNLFLQIPRCPPLKRQWCSPRNIKQNCKLPFPRLNDNIDVIFYRFQVLMQLLGFYTVEPNQLSTCGTVFLSVAYF